MKTGLWRAASVGGAGLLLALVLVLAWPASAQAGVIVTAQCGGCGYATGMLGLGGGMANYQTLCSFPAPCRRRRAVVLVNLLDKDPGARDRDGLPRVDYRDPSLRRGLRAEVLISWGEAVLYDDDYLCPACGELRLRFKEAGCWD